MLPQRLQLRAEQECSTPVSEVQRLLPESIADERERLHPAIPQGDREHADALLDRGLQSPVIDSRQQHLGVGVTAKLDRTDFGDQLGPDLFGVVDLAIEGDHIALTGSFHRLMAGSCQVTNRQAAKPDPELGGQVDKDPFGIGAAMDDGPGHLPDRLLQLVG